VGCDALHIVGPAGERLRRPRHAAAPTMNIIPLLPRAGSNNKLGMYGLNGRVDYCDKHNCRHRQSDLPGCYSSGIEYRSALEWKGILDHLDFTRKAIRIHPTLSSVTFSAVELNQSAPFVTDLSYIILLRLSRDKYIITT